MRNRRFFDRHKLFERSCRIAWRVLLLLTVAAVDLSLAAESGTADTAQIERGVQAYRQGDYATAFRLWHPLAERGIPRAQNNLGVLYRDGQGVRQNNREAVRLFRAAAAQGHMLAQFNLGRLYEVGQKVRRDYAEAAHWYRKAADQGYDMAQNNLGTLYQWGRGVRRDYVEAARWYRSAAEKGNAIAQNNLGSLYKAGKGVPRDDAEAVRWFRKAADQENAGAQYNLGEAYEKGLGVPEDLGSAQRWYDLSAKNHRAGKKRDGAIAARRRVEARLKARPQRPSKGEERHEQISCNASFEEKSFAGYPTQRMISLLSDNILESDNSPSSFKASGRKPTVNASGKPEHDGLCARVVYELDGTSASGKVEYAIYNTAPDAQRRARQANSSRFDQRILREEFFGVVVGNSWVGEERDKATARCWYPSKPKPNMRLSVVCMDLKPYSEVVTIARGDFPPGAQRDVAVRQTLGLQRKASKALAKALVKAL